MGDYNKPITARIQHSTSKGMKIQEPLLDLGSAAKSMGAALIAGEKTAAGRKPDSAGAFNAGMDSQKSESKESTDTGTTATTPGPGSENEAPESAAPASKYYAMLAANMDKGMSSKEAGKQAAEDIEKGPKSAATRSYMPKAMAKNYNNFKSYKVGEGGKR